MAIADLYVGIMSGTSLDGIDVVLADLSDADRPAVVATASSSFDASLRDALLALQQSGVDELRRAAAAANRRADLQAALVAEVLARAGVEPAAIAAIGSHGQTVRHRPERGYTIQLNAPARLAEATGVTVVADFRSRDVAAGGHGAPLVPAFHDALYRRAGVHRIVTNLGGMSNVTDLPADREAPVRGWDCGPGNVLLDGWIARHHGVLFDAAGAWSATGTVDADLLAALLADPWFALAPPKSTGRDRFGPDWLDRHLATRDALEPADVQATLVALTATALCDSIRAHAGIPEEAIVCGGGAYNDALLVAIRERLATPGRTTTVVTSADTAVGAIAPEHIEALAFAWLAQRCLHGLPGNLPAVTGARGLRILGAIHPA